MVRVRGEVALTFPRGRLPLGLATVEGAEPSWSAGRGPPSCGPAVCRRGRPAGGGLQGEGVSCAPSGLGMWTRRENSTRPTRVHSILKSLRNHCQTKFLPVQRFSATVSALGPHGRNVRTSQPIPLRSNPFGRAIGNVARAFPTVGLIPPCVRRWCEWDNDG